MADIDGLATYPELPATGHAEVDGITIVSVNCMMAMLKLPNLTWHIQLETGEHRRRRAAGGQRAARRRVQVRGGVAGDAQPEGHLPEPARRPRAHGAAQFTAPYGFGGPGQGMAVAYTRWLERHGQNREKMATLAVTQRRHAPHEPARVLPRGAAHARRTTSTRAWSRTRSASTTATSRCRARWRSC